MTFVVCGCEARVVSHLVANITWCRRGRSQGPTTCYIRSRSVQSVFTRSKPPRALIHRLPALDDWSSDKGSEPNSGGQSSNTGSPSQGPVKPAASSSADLRPSEAASDQSAPGPKGNGGNGGGDGGSPRSLQLPREVVEQLRNQVFGYDSFFVTGVENYQANGVLFQGNLRSDPATAYDKLAARLQQVAGNKYTLFLLENREEKSVAVVLPTSSLDEPGQLLPEAALVALFSLATLATTLYAAGVPLLSPQRLSGYDTGLLLRSLAGAGWLFTLLAVHEAGHTTAAKWHGAKLAPPLFIPAGLGLLGSFGTITRIKGTLKNRTELLEVAALGPAAGAAASLVLILAGLVLVRFGVGGIPVDPVAFEDSFLMGILGELLLGDKLAGPPPVYLNPVLLSGWAGLLINALNVIPAGELDGGRIAHAVWGRQTATRISTLTLFLLGVAGIFDTLSLFWVLVVIFLQRGPILPQREELSRPRSKLTPLAIGLLLLPLLALPPFPFHVAPQL